MFDDDSDEAEMSKLRKRRKTVNIERRAAILRASPCAVSIIFPIPAEMAKDSDYFTTDDGYRGTGTVIESCQGSDGTTFTSIILTAASLFHPAIDSKAVLLDDIEVEVYSTCGYLCKGKLIACDFHYNLAAVRTVTSSQLKAGELKDLDDVIPIYVDRQLRLDDLRDSSLFKIKEEDMVTALSRNHDGCLCITPGSFCVNYPQPDCKELYSHTLIHKGDAGGPVVNRHGEVIGIHVVKEYFLPANVVSRWWKYYEEHQKYCRPWLGVKVGNLHSANWNFLEEFLSKFQTTSTGVIVKEVVKSSPAEVAGLKRNDVIVQCNGEPVQSMLQFFERIWDKTGSTVTLTLQRLESGELEENVEVLDLKDNFYRWPGPMWWPRPGSGAKVLMQQRALMADLASRDNHG